MRVMQVFCRILVACGLILAGTSSAFATSLLYNGDFSLGDIGFDTSYIYSHADCWNQGSFDVVSSPHDCHSLWASFGDHTTGTGRMMVVNGATTSGMEVWSESLAVLPDTEYFFSTWVASSHPASPAQLRFSVNGTSLEIGLGRAAGSWDLLYVPWYSGENTTATLGIVNLDLASTGNDFALDDIGFDTSTPTVPIVNPEPASLVLLATGLFGVAAGLRRRRRT